MTDTPTPAPGTSVAAPARKLDLQAITAEKMQGGAMFLPSTMQECVDFASLMSRSDFAIPPRFRNNPGACLAVTIQAARWQADPFGVIQKAYVTKSKGGDERMAFEAQLFAAIINTRAPIIGRLSLTYSGEGSTRKVKVEGTFRDTGEIRSITTPEVGKIKVKNSPLWESDPDQQLGYYGMRAWGRLWTPEILLGIYTPEELQEQELVDAPRPVRQTTAQLNDAPPADEGIVKAAVEEPPVEAAATAAELLPDPPTAEPEPPITTEDAARADEMRVPATSGQARVEAAAADHGISGEGLEVPTDGDAANDPVDYSEALEGWEAYLTRAIDGLSSNDMQKEADMDDFATRTKTELAQADGITEDERDDLRARFVSAYLNAKRGRGWTRAKR